MVKRFTLIILVILRVSSFAEAQVSADPDETVPTTESGETNLLVEAEVGDVPLALGNDAIALFPKLHAILPDAIDFSFALFAWPEVVESLLPGPIGEECHRIMDATEEFPDLRGDNFKATYKNYLLCGVDKVKRFGVRFDAHFINKPDDERSVDWTQTYYWGQTRFIVHSYSRWEAPRKVNYTDSYEITRNAALRSWNDETGKYDLTLFVESDESRESVPTADLDGEAANPQVFRSQSSFFFRDRRNPEETSGIRCETSNTATHWFDERPDDSNSSRFIPTASEYKTDFTLIASSQPFLLPSTSPDPVKVTARDKHFVVDIRLTDYNHLLNGKKEYLLHVQEHVEGSEFKDEQSMRNYQPVELAEGDDNGDEDLKKYEEFRKAYGQLRLEVALPCRARMLESDSQIEAFFAAFDTSATFPTFQAIRLDW